MAQNELPVMSLEMIVTATTFPVHDLLSLVAA
jgi:hypothetical protein